MKIMEMRNIKKVLDDYGPEIACGGAIIGLGFAIYSAFKASKKVVEADEAYEDAKLELEVKEEKQKKETGAVTEEQHEKSLRKLRISRDVDYILAYKWAILFGIGSATLMIISRRLSGTKIAGLAATLALSEDKLKKLGSKVKETIGEDELKKLKKEIMQENAAEFFPNDEDVPFAFDKQEAEGDNPHNEAYAMSSDCVYDDETGTMYQMADYELRDWKQAAQKEFDTRGYLSFNKLRSLGGLEDCKFGKYAYWDKANPFKGFSIEPMRWRDKWVSAIIYENEPTYSA